MAVLKNRTQNNFTMISNTILRDRELSMKDRGVLCTICSLPDGWNFSIRGLCSLVKDGEDSIRASVKHLEKEGYIKRNSIRIHGKYAIELEVFTEKKESGNTPPSGIFRHGKTATEKPPRVDRHGLTEAVNPAQYNNEYIKRNINKDNQYVNQSEDSREMDGLNEEYRQLIADQIELPCLLEMAQAKSPEEVAMVKEIYSVICDMVCNPRKEVVIRGTAYPWNTVKAQFLKLNRRHIAEIMNRIVDEDLGIKAMVPYLISTLYFESLAGTIEAEAKIHDDYLKYLRGNPYD